MEVQNQAGAFGFHSMTRMMTSNVPSRWLTPVGNTRPLTSRMTWQPVPTANWHWTDGNPATSPCEYPQIPPLMHLSQSLTTELLHRDEHYRRSPECPFFLLINQYQQAPKKTGRGKGARTSKASRLSSQSVATIASEAPSMLDQPADYEDSVMTTASTATTGGTKKGRAKKATTAAKGRKTKAKKEEPVEVLEDSPKDDIPPPPPKAAQGRKRNSDQMDDSALTNEEAPAPKKRATRGRGRPSNTATEASVIEPEPVEDMTDASPAPPAKTTKKKGTKTTKSTRKVSTVSTISNNSFHNAAEEFPDDAEIDRQLQADLDRPLSDDEMITADSDSERKKAPVKTKGKKTTVKKAAPVVEESTSDDHAMFEPAPAEMDDADASAELTKLQEQMAAEEQQPLPIPKKGRKADTTRKASKQTKAQKAQKAVAQPEMQTDDEPATGLEDTTMDRTDISAISNGTVVRTSTAAAAAAPAPKKRGRPKKNSTQAAAPPPVPQPEPATEGTQIKLPAEVDQVDFADPLEKAATPRVSLGPKKPRKKSLPPPPVPEDELQAPTTPGPVISATPAAKQATVSPSQSPQSSDAENQPPSSKPSNTSASTRVTQIPEATTPVQSSPTKRNDNFLVGLQSNKPWSPVDIDLIFEELGKENAVPGSSLLKGMQLTSPEQKMTVEEWIHHNANLAEQRLKIECEMIVTKFESAGGKAMRSLEELVVEQ